MKLSKRLKVIADLTPENSHVIDVGADHALLDIYLNKYKNCHCLATDISDKCIIKAKENIKKYNANVKTKVADGLKGINVTDEIIIISGMGAYSILKILKKNLNNDLIISSHKDTPLLKKNLKKKGYHIYKEVVIKEKHFYIITYYKYQKGSKIKNIYATDNNEYNNYQFNIYKLKYQNEKNLFKKIKYFYIMRKLKEDTN